MKKTFWMPILALIFFILTACSSNPITNKNSFINDDEVNRVAGQLYCPICENVPLDVCPSKACADWRELIRNQIAEGKTDTEIKEYFSEQYGWNVLSMPPRIGFNWILYVLPPIIIIGGCFLVFFIIKKNKSPVGAKETTKKEFKTAELPDYIKIINRDLKDEDHDN